MNTGGRRLTKYGILAVVGLGLLAPMVPAGASVRGRRNTAIGLGALAAYQLAKGHTTTGLLAAGGAAYAYKRMQDEQKANARRAAWRRRHWARVHAYRSRHRRYVVRRSHRVASRHYRVTKKHYRRSHRR